MSKPKSRKAKRSKRSTASKRPRDAEHLLPAHVEDFEDEPATLRAAQPTHGMIERRQRDSGELNQYAGEHHVVSQVQDNMVKMLVPGMVEVWVPMSRVKFKR